MCELSKKLTEMNEYEMKLRAVFAWCHTCEWSVIDFAMLLRKIQVVIEYHRMEKETKTLGTAVLALCSGDDAQNELNSFMSARCFPGEIKKAVIWLIEYHKRKAPE